MSLGKNLFMVGIICVAFCMLQGTVAEVVEFGFTGTAFFCTITGVAGIFLVGWAWVRLSAGFASLIEHLKCGDEIETGQAYMPLIDSIADAINTRISTTVKRQELTQQQLDSMHIQLKLAQSRKDNTESIIHSIPDAVIVSDSYDRLVMANKAAGDIFGFDFEKSQRSPIAELTDNTEFIDLISNTRQARVHHIKHELEMNIPEQGDRVFDCIISCVFDGNQQVSSVTAILHDVTHQREISQMKNEFVSHVSHELKTPLASISAYAEMLVDGEADGDEKLKKQFCEVIQSQAKRLNDLIEDILDISRIESGLVKINKKTASMAILVTDAVKMIKGNASEKDIEVTEKTPIAFGQVNVDKDMILRVIINLLSNAVKYTEQGGKVSIETEVDELNRIARVIVTDTGVGIASDQIDHVFEKFYRVKEHSKFAKGTGLGLNLVKQIVESVHEGRVFVTSKPGEGSTFGFELPLAVEEMITVA